MIKKIFICIGIVAFVCLILSLYIEVNLFEGDPHIYAPHEYKGEVLEKITKADYIYGPFWLLLLLVSCINLVMPFKTLFSAHLLKNGIHLLFVLLLHIAAMYINLEAYGIISDAQIITSKTAVYTISGIKMIIPFILMFILQYIAYKFVEKSAFSKPNDNKSKIRFEILTNVLKKKN